VNPPGAEIPNDRVELLRFVENFVPIKIGRALRAKLYRDTPYWTLPQVQGRPFVLAVQDFHFANATKGGRIYRIADEIARPSANEKASRAA
jgi:hypothetical protein